LFSGDDDDDDDDSDNDTELGLDSDDGTRLVVDAEGVRVVTNAVAVPIRIAASTSAANGRSGVKRLVMVGRRVARFDSMTEKDVAWGTKRNPSSFPLRSKVGSMSFGDD